MLDDYFDYSLRCLVRFLGLGSAFSYRSLRHSRNDVNIPCGLINWFGAV